MAADAAEKGAAERSAVKKPSRSIPRAVSLFLYTQAGGRCEFPGCNKYLLEHYPTETPGNFAEQAHIYAFSRRGPRGNEAGRPDDTNTLGNLILLCPGCHKLVDSEPVKYTVEVVEGYKREHEDRIHELTGISADRRTVPLIVRGLVAGRQTEISNDEVRRAVYPNWPSLRGKVEIDLSVVPDKPDPSFWATAADTIRERVRPIYNGPDTHVSVFALAPIPLLLYLGSQLTDKAGVDLYQRHRDTETWQWPESDATIEFNHRCVASGAADNVALLINLSGRNTVGAVQEKVGENATVYELTHSGELSPSFLRSRHDLVTFDESYRRALSEIRKEHPKLDRLHVFPAVPAPITVMVGRSRLPKVDPVFLIYDRDRRADGFVETLEVA